MDEDSLTQEGFQQAGKMHCWEYMQCGHEKDASCPAVVYRAGRMCWLVSGTLCRGNTPVIISRKHKDCRGCDFFVYSAED
ncbi:MAG: hypothetical protein M0024_01150 [Nitrospiraceae bacterium]|nr:hypothetical protein [Nitrospiraceae bacterium]